MAKQYKPQGQGEDTEQFDQYINAIKVKAKKIVRVATWGILGLAGIIGGCTSIYTVPTESQAVVRRFGAYVRTTESGIHLKFPYPIEKVNKVPVKKVQEQEFGFRSLEEGEPKYAEGREFKGEYLMLTGDLNMVDGQYVVQYRINDPVAYLFNVKSPEKTLRDCSQVVMREIIGDGSVDEAITIGRVENARQAKIRLQDLMDSYSSGIEVIGVNIQSCQVPEKVRPSFNGVNQAIQQKQQRINQATEEYNKVIPKATGEAEQLIQTAEGYAYERQNEALGDARRFTQVLEQYKKAPEITRRRLFLETMERVYPGLEKTIVEQKGAEGGVLFHLGLDKTVNTGGQTK